MARRGAFGFGDLDRAFDRGLVAGHHHLAAAIVVGGLADLALRGFGGDGGGGVEIKADQRRHGADADRHRLLHGEPARAQQPRGVGEGEGAAAASAEYSPSEWPATNCASRARSRPASVSSTRSAASETAISAGCAFSVSVSVSAGPFEDEAAQLLAESAVDLVEDRAGGREIVGQRLAHADRLAALPRKYESDRHAALPHPRFAVEIGPKDTAGSRSVNGQGLQAAVTKRQALCARVFADSQGAASDERHGDRGRSRARAQDPAFRQQMMAENLDRLLAALNRMRRDGNKSPEVARQMREGVAIWRSGWPTGCSATTAARPQGRLTRFRQGFDRTYFCPTGGCRAPASHACLFHKNPYNPRDFRRSLVGS